LADPLLRFFYETLADFLREKRPNNIGGPFGGSQNFGLTLFHQVVVHTEDTSREHENPRNDQGDHYRTNGIKDLRYVADG
jgi:hypothetical protein